MFFGEIKWGVFGIFFPFFKYSFFVEALSIFDKLAW